jgi:hypothetical protein
MSQFLRIFLLLALTVGFPVTLHAQDFKQKLSLPIDCDLGLNCWPVNYVDTDPSTAAKDYQCGPRSYQNHKGTDFGILDRVALEKGVNVLAAADGSIIRFRDGQKDWPAIDTPEVNEKREELMASNKGCGNGIYINHGNEFSTIYCHLKENSIRVKSGQEVKAGDVIAQVGKSGYSEFPHLHFGVYKDGKIYDPFTSGKYEGGCTAQAKPMWKNDISIPYKKTTLYAAGFKDAVPDFDALKVDASSTRTISITTDVFAFWAGFYGASKGDKIHMRILGPNGNTFVEQKITQKEDKARQFYFVGRNIKKGMLNTGEYTGLITIQSKGPKGTETETIARTVMIE